MENVVEIALPPDAAGALADGRQHRIVIEHSLGGESIKIDGVEIVKNPRKRCWPGVRWSFDGVADVTRSA